MLGQNFGRAITRPTRPVPAGLYIQLSYGHILNSFIVSIQSLFYRSTGRTKLDVSEVDDKVEMVDVQPLQNVYYRQEMCESLL